MPPSTTEVVRALVEGLQIHAPSDPAVDMGLEWLKAQELLAEVASLPSWVKTKPCYNCAFPIFFAASRSGAGKYDKSRWVPMCPVPLKADVPIIDAVTLDWSPGLGKDRPMIRETMPGIQWLPHGVLCGMTHRPMSEELGRVWDETVGKQRAEEQDVLSGLVQILKDTE